HRSARARELRSHGSRCPRRQALRVPTRPGARLRFARQAPGGDLMPITQQRVAEMLREAISYLSQHETRTRQEVLDHVAATMRPTADENEIDTNGRPAWKTRFLWTSVGIVKAGWATKDGNGIWAATQAGRDALAKYPDAESFRLALRDAYREWE